MASQQHQLQHYNSQNLTSQDSRKLQPINTNPDQIPTHILDDLLCRFIINLPEDEKQAPRIFCNLKIACWFFADFHCSIAPVIDRKYEMRFAQRICQRWSGLSHVLQNFESKFEEYKQYLQMIPSFGALMFSKKFEKLLFIVYQNERDKNVNKLDFPKGKADEGESDVECAIREINEEIQFNIRPYIEEDQFIKIETIKNKFVTLYLVKDIDTKNYNVKRVRSAEVQKVEWIDTKFYLEQTLLSGVEEQQMYNWQLVQPFAYYVAHFISTQQQITDIGTHIKYQKILPYELDQDQKYQSVQRILNKFNDQKKFYEFKYQWRDQKYFLVALYYHMIQHNYKKAKQLYKQAIRRSECPKGAFNMLVSLLISQYSEPQILRKKIDKLADKVAIYLSHDYEFLTTMDRVQTYINYLNFNRPLNQNTKKNQNEEYKQQMMILSLKNIHQKIRNQDDDFEKIMTLVQVGQYLKFDPFILNMKIAFERGDKKGYQGGIQKFRYYSNTQQKQGYFNDMMIIECASEQEVHRLKDYTMNNQAFICCKFDILLDGQPFSNIPYELNQSVDASQYQIKTQKGQQPIQNERQKNAAIFLLTFKNIFERIQERVAFEKLKPEIQQIEEKVQFEEEKETIQTIIPEVEEKKVESVVQQVEEQKEEPRNLKGFQPLQFTLGLDPEAFANSILQSLQKQFDPKAFTQINYKAPHT
eukprot:403363471